MSYILYTKGRYLVMASAAYMPMSCWGRYGYVAVMKRLEGAKPRCIRDSKRAIVLWRSPPSNIGSTKRCAFEKACVIAHMKMMDEWRRAL